MTDTKQRLFNLLNILSLRAARLLITFEYYIPSYLKPRRTSSSMIERNEFVRTLIEQELQESYSSEEILHCRNIINSNDTSKMEMGIIIDLKAAISRFKLQHPSHIYIQNLNVLSLLPYRTQCNNFRNGIECGDQLRLDFHMNAYVVYPTSIQPCTLYSADCRKCNKSYRVSSIYCINEQKFILTPEALDKNPYFHLSSGKLVYSREMLISFSSDLVNGHISFHGAGTSLLSKIERLQSEPLVKNFDAVQLTRSLEAHWIYYELFHLIFMTSSEKEIVAPRALFSGRNTAATGDMINAKAQFLEEHLDWIYNIFSVFWSNHNLIPECRCDKPTCSKALIIDGHQKPRRTICRYDNVTSLINEEELGPCNRGCPYQPRKRKSNQTMNSKSSPFYCIYHQDSGNERSAYAEEDYQRDRAWIKQLKIIEDQYKQTNDIVTDEQCNVVRSEEDEKLENKRRSMGFLASFLSCGVVIGFTESINHEGVRKVTDHLLTMIKMGVKIPDALVYDSACNLKLFWNKNYGGIHLKETPSSRILFNMRVAVDRFHIRNHVHNMCNTITNPDCVLNGNDDIYNGINTVIAEQSFRYLTEFKLSIRRLAYPTSTIFSILLLHLWNCRNAKISPDHIGLASKCFPEKIKSLYLTHCIFESTQLYQKKSSSTFLPSIHIQEQNNEENDQMNIDNDLEQLDYDCVVNLEQYAWESDEEYYNIDDN